MSSLEELFWHIDEFCGQFEPQWRKSQLQQPGKRRNRRRALCLSEMLTILVAFHQQHYRNATSRITTSSTSVCTGEPLSQLWSATIALSNGCLQRFSLYAFTSSTALGLAQELALLMPLASRFVTIGASIVTTYLPIWQREGKLQLIGFLGSSFIW